MTGRFFALVLTSAILSTTSIGATTFFDLLQQSAGEEETPLAVTLELPLDSVYAKTQYEQDAWFSFVYHTGLAQRRPLHVDVRGKFRRRICTFPPLKLNFLKKDLKSIGLEKKYDKFKLVTPCLEDEEGQQLVLREFIAYRLLNQLSSASFRVQLIEITYRDVNGNFPDQTRFAFILEDTDEMAARLGGKELEDVLGLSPDRFDRRYEVTQAMFSYYIGNTDWNVSMSRNVKMVGLEDGTIIPVPYDFDFSAFVNAPYALPSNSVGQYALQQRVYLGFIAGDELLTEVFSLFSSQRKELNRFVRQFKLLPLINRTAIITYLDGFFPMVREYLKNEELGETVYVRFRGDQLEMVPAGAVPAHYGVVRK